MNVVQALMLVAVLVSVVVAVWTRNPIRAFGATALTLVIGLIVVLAMVFGERGG